MITPQDSDLLLHIQRAPDAGWARALGALAQMTGAARATLYLPGQAWTQHGPDPRALPAGLAGLRLGRVYTGEELSVRIALDGPVHSGSDCRAIGLRLTDQTGWLLLERDKRQFRAVDSALLTAIAPHVELAATQAAAKAAHMASAARSNAVARKLGVGWLQFGAPPDPIAMDGIAQALIARLGHFPTAPMERDRTLTIPLAPWLEMLWSPGAENTGMAYLRATDTPLPPPQIIAQCLGLTLSEARLVRALGMGATLTEAAAQLGLTVETARAYSRQVFAKTGLRGQPALMRRLWTSALVLG